jgi:hypothetical protein
VNSVAALPGVSGGRGTALLLHAVPARLIPTRWTFTTTLPGQGFPVRAADPLAVVARFIEPIGAFATTLFDDDLV